MVIIIGHLGWAASPTYQEDYEVAEWDGEAPAEPQSKKQQWPETDWR